MKNDKAKNPLLPEAKISPDLLEVLPFTVYAVGNQKRSVILSDAELRKLCEGSSVAVGDGTCVVMRRGALNNVIEAHERQAQRLLFLLMQLTPDELTRLDLIDDDEHSRDDVLRRLDAKIKTFNESHRRLTGADASHGVGGAVALQDAAEIRFVLELRKRGLPACDIAEQLDEHRRMMRET